jgi:hypothetical protein
MGSIRNMDIVYMTMVLPASLATLPCEKRAFPRNLALTIVSAIAPIVAKTCERCNRPDADRIFYVTIRQDTSDRFTSVIHPPSPLFRRYCRYRSSVKSLFVCSIVYRFENLSSRMSRRKREHRSTYMYAIQKSPDEIPLAFFTVLPTSQI